MRKSLALGEKMGQAAIELSEILIETERESEAIEVLQAAVKGKPEFVAGFSRLHELLGEAGRTAEQAEVEDCLVSALMATP